MATPCRRTTAAYGKLILIDRRTGAAHTFTKGHRNPQGLHVDEDGRIWSTEHGPRGGDELNLIREDENYGWPLATSGTTYGDELHYRDTTQSASAWPPLQWGGSHGEFTEPIFTWGPSTGISELTSVRRDLFTQWKGDLLITSLLSGTLFRTRIRDGRVVHVEPIQIGERIRDIVEMNDGTLVLKTDGGTLVYLRPAVRDEPAMAMR